MPNLTQYHIKSIHAFLKKKKKEVEVTFAKPPDKSVASIYS